MVYRDKAHRLVIRDKSALTRIILTDSGLVSPSKSLCTFFEPYADMGRQRHSRTEPHGATSDTVLRTSWLPCSSSLCSAGDMGRRFLCKQSASRLVTAVSTAVACRQLTSLRRYISRPQGVLWEGGTLSRSLACGSTTRYYLATPDGVCSSHHSELLIPNYTLLRPLAGRRTIARSGALARLRDIATPTFQDPSWVARRMHIGDMGRRRAGAPEVCRLSENPVRCPAGRVRGEDHIYIMSPGGTMSSRTTLLQGASRRPAGEPLRGSLIDNPTLTRQRLCGESRMTHIYNAVGVAFIHEATKQHLRRCFAPSSHLPHIVAALQCGAIYKATAKRLALNHENSLIY